MSEQKWTPEPWKKQVGALGAFIHQDTGHGGPYIAYLTDGGNEADLDRIVACVNACEGVPAGIQPGAVKALADALKNLSSMAQTSGGVSGRDPELYKAIQQADSALCLYHGDE